MKSLILALIVIFGIASSAQALELKRGVATDIWISWPNDAELVAPGFLDVFPEWRRTVSIDKIAGLRTAGFDFIRLTIDPFAFLSQPNESRAQRLIAQTLATVADIRATGLQVVVDLHAIPAGGYRSIGTDEILADAALFARHTALVARFAAALAPVDDGGIAFELINEPTIDCDEQNAGAPSRWPAMLQRLFQAARGAAPELPLIVSGTCWGGAEGLVRLDANVLPREMFTDAKVLWSFHSYDPFLATHQGASWTGAPVSLASGIAYPPDCAAKTEQAAILVRIERRLIETVEDLDKRQTYRDDARATVADYCTPGRAAAMLQEPFDKVTTWAKRMGIPASRLLLGEFGMIRGDDPAKATLPEHRAQLMRDIRAEAEQRGIAWAVWSHGGSFGITLDDASRTLDPLFTEALGLK